MQRIAQRTRERTSQNVLDIYLLNQDRSLERSKNFTDGNETGFDVYQLLQLVSSFLARDAFQSVLYVRQDRSNFGHHSPCTHTRHTLYTSCAAAPPIYVWHDVEKRPFLQIENTKFLEIKLPTILTCGRR